MDVIIYTYNYLYIQVCACVAAMVDLQIVGFFMAWKNGFW